VTPASQPINAVAAIATPPPILTRPAPRTGFAPPTTPAQRTRAGQSQQRHPGDHRDPGAGGAAQWKRAHNELHHTYTNVIGRDNDLG
jgi:hypothetical protein